MTLLLIVKMAPRLRWFWPQLRSIPRRPLSCSFSDRPQFSQSAGIIVIIIITVIKMAIIIIVYNILWSAVASLWSSIKRVDVIFGGNMVEKRGRETKMAKFIPGFLRLHFKQVFILSYCYCYWKDWEIFRSIDSRTPIDNFWQFWQILTILPITLVNFCEHEDILENSE